MHPLERLVNLVALLLESRTPLTFDQIRGKLAEGYGHEDASSAKRMFERDKDVLRDIGVPIEVVATDAWDVEHGYAIDKERYYLPDIAFTPEELSALFIAVRSAGDISAEDAVRKLLSGADRGILAGLGPPALGGETDPNLPRAAEAVAGSGRVRFSYRTSRGERSDRTVDAFGLAVRGGHWYLVGMDRDRGDIRSFRLSRVSGDVEIAGEGTEPPPGFRAADHVQAGPLGAWRGRDHRDDRVRARRRLVGNQRRRGRRDRADARRRMGRGARAMVAGRAARLVGPLLRAGRRWSSGRRSCARRSSAGSRSSLPPEVPGARIPLGRPRRRPPSACAGS